MIRRERFEFEHFISFEGDIVEPSRVWVLHSPVRDSSNFIQAPRSALHMLPSRRICIRQTGQPALSYGRKTHRNHINTMVSGLAFAPSKNRKSVRETSDLTPSWTAPKKLLHRRFLLHRDFMHGASCSPPQCRNAGSVFWFRRRLPHPSSLPSAIAAMVQPLLYP